MSNSLPGASAKPLDACSALCPDENKKSTTTRLERTTRKKIIDRVPPPVRFWIAQKYCRSQFVSTREKRPLNVLHIHIDQCRPFLFFNNLDRSFYCRANLLRFGDRSLAVDAEGAGQVGKIYGRLGHFHAD